MDTFFARNRLSAYLDGDLPIGEAREVELALNRDPDLRAEYDQLRSAVDFLRSNGPIPAPEGFANRLHIRLAQEPAPSRLRVILGRIRPERVGIFAVAAAALLFVGTRHADEVEPSPAPTVAAAKAPSVLSEPSPTVDGAGELAANGVLGDEGGFAGVTSPSKVRPPMQKQSGVDKEAFQAEWEKDPDAQVVAEAGAPEGQNRAPGQVATQSAPSESLYSPAPWRYRIRSTSANPLKDLMAVAASLGGRIVDAKGRPIGDYPMEEGDSKAVRVFVPSYNVEALQRKLEALGTVDTIATDPDVLYQNGAEVPVSIEVMR